ncbi:DUF2637 domain-containing protein [Micromonospora chalcea]
MLLIGGAAGAASFTHVHDVAAGHGQPGWLAWADAIVLELTSIAAGLELRRKRRLGKSVAFPATVLTVAVLLSLAAQVVEAEASVIGWIAAALPALGFLAMVKIALGRADTAPPHPTAQPARGSALTVDASVPDTRPPVPVTAAEGRDSATAVPVVADQPPAVPDRRDDEASTGEGGPEVAALVPAPGPPPAPSPPPGHRCPARPSPNSSARTGTSCPTPPPPPSYASYAPKPPRQYQTCHTKRPVLSQ